MTRRRAAFTPPPRSLPPPFYSSTKLKKPTGPGALGLIFYFTRAFGVTCWPSYPARPIVVTATGDDKSERRLHRNKNAARHKNAVTLFTRRLRDTFVGVPNEQVEDFVVRLRLPAMAVCLRSTSRSGSTSETCHFKRAVEFWGLRATRTGLGRARRRGDFPRQLDPKAGPRGLAEPTSKFRRHTTRAPFRDARKTSSNIYRIFTLREACRRVKPASHQLSRSRDEHRGIVSGFPPA